MIYNRPEYWIKKEPRAAFLTFISPNPFSIKTNNSIKNWDGVLEYSTDTANWKEWDGSEISARRGNDGYALYFSGTGNTVITGDSSSNSWSITGTNVQCIGNIETLLDYEMVNSGEHPTMGKYCYYYMFSGCTSLTQAPALSATKLAEDCYGYMFKGCTSLTQAPSLPSTSMWTRCYGHMFEDCTGLTTAPSLLATTTDAYSCQYMFSGCTNLTQVPKLLPTHLIGGCYQYMFMGCTKIKLSDTQTGEYTQAYRIPYSGDYGVSGSKHAYYMFYKTGGTFKGTPSLGTTYYLSSSNEIV